MQKDNSAKFRSKAINLITRKRLYEFYQEGKTPEKDKHYDSGELALYALYQAVPPQYKLFVENGDGSRQPFPSDFPPINYRSSKEARIDQLLVAASLISREIDRLLELSETEYQN